MSSPVGPTDPLRPDNPVPAALRTDGAAPRPAAARLLMLALLLAICAAVTIPTVVVTRIFGQRPRPKTRPAASGLRSSLQRSAGELMPLPSSLTPEPLTVTVRPDHVGARLEKVRRQAERFGGTATEGLPSGEARHLFIDLPTQSTAAFRAAVTANAPLDDGSPGAALPSPAGPATMDHLEIIIRPAADDE